MVTPQSIQKLMGMMSPCTLCPRACKALRAKGQAGFCGIGTLPVVSSSGPHFGEEDVLVGRGGSGTIFFAGCNLGCIFCQNYQISHLRQGSQVSVDQLAQTMLDLQAMGCVNINLVTPTHLAGTIAMAIAMAREQGLHVPIVYNSGGYDSVETLSLLEGFIDIYMPDMKYADDHEAAELSHAPDYTQVNRNAVLEMHRQVGGLQIRDGIAVRGLLVRHLVLPGGTASSNKVIDWLAEHLGPDTAINVMGQYRPCYRAHKVERLRRPPTIQEIQAVRDYAQQMGLRLID